MGKIKSLLPRACSRWLVNSTTQPTAAVNPPNSSREIQERAAYWLIEQEDAAFSEEDRARFDVWLSDSPLHQSTYLAFKRAWDRTLVLRQPQDRIRTIPPRSGSLRSGRQ
jgi:ferric-dicitrate binding protein FerR (iron transport regulator)